ncbi:dTDP-4-dehydrorhamnose 3,5-epimerase [Ornithobacterium rhinotracheale]|uniref:dTDP-4-dehydrorhamnose 3,5-epimerase n=1 Tax=Ornithobacterium rhinotracheale TaxID=28251 RepID=UPI00129CCECB|nr:dTDP-4-dehydrorhamnose 3,5-epimerase [Ornithobacterium rhinotracheale]MRJ07499.1 dTDP-4-dehydrorhamnose 3,5-epimerase [Ornithobacterium rhinotracheale]UOH78093.1 dTDP-4-dehydrorhamnose 3,5-epimerase [Ornithobacterium rhinotracheale]
MTVKTTEIQDCFLIQPQIFGDERGYFFESYNEEKFNQATGLNIQFVQDNQSYSTQGVIRGLHIQLGQYAQAKLVRVLQGKVLDVAVDARKNSPTFGKIICIELSAENQTQLFIPRGCLHGFSVLSEDAIFQYKCDNYYNKASESGVIFNDRDLNIDWKIEETNASISEKDRELNSWQNFIDKL